MNQNETDAAVAIVGAGPVGLSAAIDLGRRGHRVVVLEQRSEPSNQPRAHVINARTMELFRQWGVADDIDRAGLPRHLATGFGWLTSMSAEALATLDYVDEVTAESNSPERLVSCAQDLIEAALRDRVAGIPSVSVRFGVRVDDVTQDRHGATLRTTDGEVRARYVIACDGAGSTVRERLGVSLDRSEALATRANIYFHADLSEATRRRPYILWFIMAAQTQGIFIALNGCDRWVYSVEVPADLDIRSVFTDEHCTQLLRTATGAPTLRPRVQGVLRWKVAMAIADRWRVGNVFLAGDAAHQFPPMGGFGMNSGIQDVHNLAWKIDEVLRSQAEPALLDTYQPERRQVAELNAQRSMVNARNQQQAAAALSDPAVLELFDRPEGAELRARFAAGVAQQRDEFHSQGKIFGSVYTSAAVRPDGTVAPESTIERYVATSHPGARAPHVRLRRPDGSDVSTIGLVDGWTLLTARVPWPAPAGVRTCTIGTDADDARVDLVDGDGRWASVYGLAPGGAVLIRPDGHVGARWTHAPVDPAAAVRDALDRIRRSA